MASRANSLYIISVLKEHSTESSPLPISEIEKKVRDIYFQDHPEESLNKSTIGRILAELVEHIFDPYDFIGAGIPDPLHLGFCIGCCTKCADGSFIPYAPDRKDNHPRSKSPTLYYYYKSAFDDSEIELMISALEAHNYLSAEDVAGLVAKLAGLSHELSGHKNKKYENNPDPRIEDAQAHTLEYLSILHEAIQKEQFVHIWYCHYDENHKLVSISKNPKTVRPVRMMFNNGYYYLIAVEYSSSKKRYFTVHYRIDRFGDIDPFEPSPDEREAYRCEQPEDPAAYRLKHPVMYGDDLVNMRMLVKRSPFMLNTLMDFFGSNARIRSATDKDMQQVSLLYSDMTEEWLHVAVKASRGGMALFATEYCAHVRILSPEDLIENVISDLKTGLAMYGRSDRGLLI